MSGIAALWLFWGVWLVQGQNPVRPDVPDELKTPADEKLVLVAHAEGVQIYACKAGEQGHYAWTLQGPRAELFDAEGKRIGKHYADPKGPAWELANGSKVIGKKVAAHSVPQAIPWLLLTSVESRGDAPFGQVKSIQRLHTKGGLEPESGCDEAHAGAPFESTYAADYYFYAPAK